MAPCRDGNLAWAYLWDRIVDIALVHSCSCCGIPVINIYILLHCYRCRLSVGVTVLNSQHSSVAVTCSASADRCEAAGAYGFENELPMAAASG